MTRHRGAEAAGARAAVAQNHESGRAVFPAVSPVGTFATAANSVQSVLCDGVFHHAVFLATLYPGVQPARLP